MQHAFCIALIVAWVIIIDAHSPCNVRTTEYGTICVCNSTYCDTVPAIEDLKCGGYQLFSTSKNNLGFSSTTGNFFKCLDATQSAAIIINPSITYQSIIGFGGSFTDATGINILRLSDGAQESLMQAYFGQNGIQFSVGRIPIAGTDFSTRGYTYCDIEDPSLSLFALQKEDHLYKIPFLQRASKIRGSDNIKYFASAWSSPKWMKSNNEYDNSGKLKDEYYDTWAKYHLKYLQAYEWHNIKHWGLTTQNEPILGLIGSLIQNIGFNSHQMIRWVKDSLGPAIRSSSSYNFLKIMLHDDQRVLLPILNLFLLSNEEVVEYADGVAVHWYSDNFTSPRYLNFASTNQKRLFRLATEACSGFGAIMGMEPAVALGSWERGEGYLSSIIDDLNFDLGGWVNWNMALNESGGPTWIHNEVDAPIIVNGTADEFYKQPTFYVLGHFSKFVSPGSVRIDSKTSETGISALAFLRPDGRIAVVLWNRLSEEKSIKITILDREKVLTLEANSINTLIYAI